MKKDFSKTSYRNPRVEKQEKRRKNKVKYIIILSLVIILLGLFYLFLLSPVFKIKKVVIAGTNKAEWQIKIEEMVKNQQRLNVVFSLRQSNLFLFSLVSLERDILNNFELESVKLSKDYPQTLKIELELKKPALIWQAGDNYYAVNEQGILIKSININELEFDLPIVSYNTTTHVALDQSIIGSNNVEFIQQIKDEVKKSFKDWEVNRFKIDQIGSQHIKAYTSEGWYIFFNSQNSLDTQIGNLKALLKEKVTDRSRLQYIDVRLGERLFYK